MLIMLKITFWSHDNTMKDTRNPINFKLSLYMYMYLSPNGPMCFTLQKVNTAEHCFWDSRNLWDQLLVAHLRKTVSLLP